MNNIEMLELTNMSRKFPLNLKGVVALLQGEAINGKRKVFVGIGCFTDETAQELKNLGYTVELAKDEEEEYYGQDSIKVEW